MLTRPSSSVSHWLQVQKHTHMHMLILKMTPITELPFDVHDIIVNEYLQPKDAVTLSLTSTGVVC